MARIFVDTYAALRRRFPKHPAFDPARQAELDALTAEAFGVESVPGWRDTDLVKFTVWNHSRVHWQLELIS